jgi:hypothetical protein
MLEGTHEFVYGFILLRNRHLPLLSYALIMEVGPVTGAGNFRGKRYDRRCHSIKTARQQPHEAPAA